MSEHTEDRRLPETWEEYQRARREAWHRGANDARYGFPSGNGSAKDYMDWRCREARRRYPITRAVPRSIILESGAVARATAEGVEIEGLGEHLIRLRHGSVQALADLMKHPIEEVAG